MEEYDALIGTIFNSMRSNQSGARMSIDAGIQFIRRTLRLWVIASSLTGLLMSADAARADKRVAFVAGNGAYKNAPKLSSPPTDAIAMAKVLRSIGFDVVEGTNLTRSETKEKLIDFGNRADCADIAVFFFAGHSVARVAHGMNFLLPIDADIKWMIDLLDYGTAINVMLSKIMNKAKVKLVFLDASYENPFAARINSSSPGTVNAPIGLVEIRPDAGMLVAYSAGIGQVVPGSPQTVISPFTRSLITHIAQPGVEIQQAMKSVRAQVQEETNSFQFPWGDANLKDPVFLNPIPASTDTGVVDASSTSRGQRYECKSRAVEQQEEQQQEQERKLWLSVEWTDAQDLRAYLKTYPKGQFSPLARGKLASLDEPQPIPLATLDSAAYRRLRDQAEEDKIGLNRSRRIDVQRQMRALSFEIRITGEFDHDTRWAIKRWQAARGHPVSGYLDARQHEALFAEKVAAGGARQ